MNRTAEVSLQRIADALTVPGPKTERVIQLVPWRDLLLVLTDQGRVYQMEYSDSLRDGPHLRVMGAPLFNGFPPGWPDRR